MSGAGEQPRLRVKTDRLTDLADDLDGMQDYLDKQVKRMDVVVDRIEAGWRGPAAQAYRDLHRGAAEDAVRIRLVIQALEQAVRFSRDGFSEQELDVMAQLRKIQVETDVKREVDALSTPNTDVPAVPRSRLSEL
ncbi:WXG100 family type VII secretion target [Streptomyces sp. WZ.A104]|uniref:WXG100 family type VII secretion target n=1 Tax=Streptomyces durocortorensis TaxID=2811104 RepID=A0ABY9VWI7_9ACTN|nr:MULTISPECIES: WXG100 family type VII secretion target [Streptomyces]PCG82949.1 WXG100 family type VII secretion target [Streptomyces sp. WZ.A104]WNF27983.1 WXG100 family type VII secretion target [Streptomyces durocortorensis]